MDINNILNKIENYKTATAERAEQERIAEEHRRQSLFDRIQVMKPDIDNLIKVANTAKEAGIPIHVKFPDTNFTYENGDFMTDAMTHKIGFIPSSLISEGIIGVGFEGGGYCGQYDFFTNGQAILDRNRDNGRDKPASTEHLEKFIKKFPEFERVFYDYIERKTGCEPIIKNMYFIEVCDYNGEKVLESRWFNSVEEAENWWRELGYFCSGDYNAKIWTTKSADGRTVYGEDDDYDAEFVKYLQ